MLKGRYQMTRVSAMAVLVLLVVLVLFVWDIASPGKVLIPTEISIAVLIDLYLIGQVLGQRKSNIHRASFWTLFFGAVLGLAYFIAVQQYAGLQLRSFHPYAFALLIGFGFWLHPMSRLVIDKVRNWIIRRDQIADTQQPSSRDKLNTRIVVIALLLCAGIFLTLAIRRLNFTLLGDEYYQFNTAVGHMKTGQFFGWNFLSDSTFIHYSGSWITTLCFDAMMRLFGISPLAARLATLVAGLALIPLAYGVVTKLLRDRLVAVVSVFFISTNLWFVTYSTFVRMYIFFVLTSLGFFYFVFRSWNKDERHFRPWYCLGAGTMFGLSYLIHPIAAALGGFWVGYYMWMAWRLKLKTLLRPFVRIIIIGSGIIGSIAILENNTLYQRLAHFLPLQGYVRDKIQNLLNPISQRSFFDFSFYFCVALIVLIACFFRKKSEGYKYLLFCFLFFHIVFNTVILHRDHARYISFLFITNISLLLYSVHVLTRWFFRRMFVRVLVLLTVVFAINGHFALSKNVVSESRTLLNPYYYEKILRPFDASAERINFSALEPILRRYYRPGIPVIGHYVPLWSYYLKDVLVPPVEYYELVQMSDFYSVHGIHGGIEDLSINDIEQIKEANPNGMFVWQALKEYQINANVRQYVQSKFQQVAGEGIDDVGVNVFIW